MFGDWANPWIGQSLCVLYVAMTRAVHSLDMIVGPSKPNEKTWPKTFAGLLRSALAPGKAAEPETTLFEHGDAAGGGAGQPGALWAPPMPDIPIPRQAPTVPQPQHLNLPPTHTPRTALSHHI